LAIIAKFQVKRYHRKEISGAGRQEQLGCPWMVESRLAGPSSRPYGTRAWVAARVSQDFILGYSRVVPPGTKGPSSHGYAIELRVLRTPARSSQKTAMNGATASDSSRCVFKIDEWATFRGWDRLRSPAGETLGEMAGQSRDRIDARGSRWLRIAIPGPKRERSGHPSLGSSRFTSRFSAENDRKKSKSKNKRKSKDMSACGCVDSHPFHDEAVKWMGHPALQHRGLRLSA